MPPCSSEDSAPDSDLGPELERFDGESPRHVSELAPGYAHEHFQAFGPGGAGE